MNKNIPMRCYENKGSRSNSSEIHWCACEFGWKEPATLPCSRRDSFADLKNTNVNI